MYRYSSSNPRTQEADGATNWLKKASSHSFLSFLGMCEEYAVLTMVVVAENKEKRRRRMLLLEE